MKRSELTWKDYLAVIIALASIAGLVVMFNAEGFVVLKDVTNPTVVIQQFNKSVLPGIKDYSLAIGALLLAVSVSFILLGSQEDISTSLDEQNLKK